MTDSTIKTLPIEQRVYLHKELVHHGILPTCMSCKHMPDMNEALCERYQQKPPLQVIITGCVGWEQDIPF